MKTDLNLNLNTGIVLTTYQVPALIGTKKEYEKIPAHTNTQNIKINRELKQTHKAIHANHIQYCAVVVVRACSCA